MTEDEKKNVSRFDSFAETVKRANDLPVNQYLRQIGANHSLFENIYGSKANADWLDSLRAVSAGGIADIYAKTLQPERANLEDQINALKREISKKVNEIDNAQSKTGDLQARLEELAGKHAELQEKQSLTHILNRVGEQGARKVLRDSDFRAKFQNDTPCTAYVLAIDIRRSTELMLKARDPKQFASFITTLAISLRQIVIDNYGVFDKFTGDGILAIFPEFFSGDDAGYRVIDAAIRCHQIFDEIYKKHRHCFMAVLKDAGLGIGIDYGFVQIVEIGGEFTVVGTPVVYACRMSGAPAYQTLVNQPAYEQLFKKYSTFDFEESEIDVKHEGRTIAYMVNPNGKSFEPKPPSWLSDDSQPNIA